MKSLNCLRSLKTNKYFLFKYFLFCHFINRYLLTFRDHKNKTVTALLQVIKKKHKIIKMTSLSKP